MDPTQYPFMNVDSIKSVKSKINKFNFTLDCIKTMFSLFYILAFNEYECLVVVIAKNYLHLL